MVLSDRFGGKPRPSLLKRTLIYVLGFALGSLMLVGILSFTMMSIAEGVFPPPKDRAAAKRASDNADADGNPVGKPARNVGSKARGRRGNEASDEAPDQPL